MKSDITKMHGQQHIKTSNARNKIKLMTSMYLRHVLAAGCHPQGDFQMKGIKPNALIRVCIAVIGMIEILEF